MDQPKRRAVSVALLTLAAPLAGCSVTPTSRLEACHKQCQSLQAETVQLRDNNLRLGDQNRDLVQRSVDDARRLHALETANRQYEQSVLAYQKDLRRLETAFDDLKRQVQATAEASPADHNVQPSSGP